jgi:hypothetical protein
MGLGIFAVILRWVRLKAGRRGAAPSPHAGGELIPPGYAAFPVVGAVVGAALGVIAGLSASLSLLPAAGTWTVLGLAYGLLIWAAAHHGYFPFPDEE